jgi:hypothetical protein
MVSMMASASRPRSGGSEPQSGWPYRAETARPPHDARKRVFRLAETEVAETEVAETEVAETEVAETEVAETEGQIAVPVELREKPSGVAVGGEELDDGFEVDGSGSTEWQCCNYRTSRTYSGERP